jgi:hypothetical protein
METHAHMRIATTAHRFDEVVTQVLRVQNVAEVCELLTDGNARPRGIHKAPLVPPHHFARTHALLLPDHLQVAAHEDWIEDLKGSHWESALLPLLVGMV